MMSLLLFVVAAGLEIAGCFAFWRWVRNDASFFIPAAGVCSLVGFAATLTRVDTAFAGRAYAAYGGIYIAASLLWLWGVEGVRPDRWDLAGAALCLAGMATILFAPHETA